MFDLTEGRACLVSASNGSDSDMSMYLDHFRLGPQMNGHHQARTPCLKSATSSHMECSKSHVPSAHDATMNRERRLLDTLSQFPALISP
jgi:hypothetical protein